MINLMTGPQLGTLDLDEQKKFQRGLSDVVGVGEYVAGQVADKPIDFVRGAGQELATGVAGLPADLANLAGYAGQAALKQTPMGYLAGDYKDVLNVGTSEQLRELLADLFPEMAETGTISEIAGQLAGGFTNVAGLAKILGKQLRKTKRREPVTQAEKVADQILIKLEQGKIDEIDDDMMAIADDVYLNANYDLPMDTKSRQQRAKDMGFDLDDVMYHGTTRRRSYLEGPEPQIESFDTYDRSRALFTTDNPYVADTYAGGYNGHIFPLVTNRPADISVDVGGQLYKDLRPNMPVTVGGDPSSASTIAGEFPYFNDFGATPISTDDLVRESPASSVLEFQNMIDVGTRFPTTTKDMSKAEVEAIIARSREPSKIVANIEATGVRTPFARFDPRLEHLKNISAAALPASFLGSLLTSTDENF